MTEFNPCLIGQVFVDFVENPHDEPAMRLGGLMHAARALWAMGEEFGFAYIAPEYLRQDVERFAKGYGATTVCQIGSISGCPNVVIVGEGKEAGSQKYEYLLRLQSVCTLNSEMLTKSLREGNWTDFVVFPGGFPLGEVLSQLAVPDSNVYVDINFIPDLLDQLCALCRKLTCAILSTSSALFQTTYGGNPARVVEGLAKYGELVLLKENRGGSRLFYPHTGKPPVNVPCHVKKVLHSVGVGDFFNTVFASKRKAFDDAAALGYASLGAAEYASALDDCQVRDSMQAVLSIDPGTASNLAGVSLPWEKRKVVNIYLAAPDFDFVDTAPLEAIAEALTYHNFSPRRPVREHGQVRENTGPYERRDLAEADVQLLRECTLLIAVLLYNDPGTFIEIGMALEWGMPVIVYDPFKLAENLMLKELPNLVSADLDEVIAETFIQASRLV